jgi:hypothetical protein
MLKPLVIPLPRSEEAKEARRKEREEGALVGRYPDCSSPRTVRVQALVQIFLTNLHIDQRETYEYYIQYVTNCFSHLCTRVTRPTWLHIAV